MPFIFLLFRDKKCLRLERQGAEKRCLMARSRCLWCIERPIEEVAVLKWRGEEQERLTVQLCRKHLARLRQAGDRGRENKGWSYKLGWW